jgi:hypothetical protein
MSWVHDTGYGPALDHDGGVEDVLEDGTDPSTPPDQIGPRVIGWRSACQCGWQGTQFYLRSEWPGTEYGLAPRRSNNTAWPSGAVKKQLVLLGCAVG